MAICLSISAAMARSAVPREERTRTFTSVTSGSTSETVTQTLRLSILAETSLLTTSSPVMVRCAKALRVLS